MKILLSLAVLLVAASAHAQMATPALAIYNTAWHYSLSGYEVDITFTSDSTLRWQDKNRSETDKSKTIRINDHTLLVGWQETDKTFVSLYSNFASGEAYCHVFRPDGKVMPMKGTLVSKK